MYLQRPPTVAESSRVATSEESLYLCTLPALETSKVEGLSYLVKA